MALRGNALTNACLLIILMRVFSVRSLTCHLTEYQIGNECCPMCPPGNRVRRDCTEIISTSCLSCAEGTYMDKPNGQKQCMSCSVCGSGGLNLKIKQACMQTSDTVCEPLEGFFCTDSTSGSCTSANKHKLCKPGQYINKTGTSSSDTECSDCSTGTFSDGSVTSCQPHTQCETLKLQLIKAGTASADAECGEKSFTGIVIGAVVGAAVVLAGLAVTTILYIKKKRKKPEYQHQRRRRRRKKK
ncbi:tumor necrosis factor receptor superfamily member 14 [Nematolebias whitei]|uniref:tumor necrosis factor receptor superfamily member 14 n=1 Tax=Nematolebias whitei TaxID=451745 RepID=UPI0018986417|nr:tumor necrosis factor receptor superfamily member 14 [Nematolebias whitei]